MGRADQPPTSTRPSWWHVPMWMANLVAAVILLLTYLSPIVSPKFFWPLAVLAMSFTYQLLLHAFFLVWWFFFRRKRMLLSGALLLIGYSHIGDHLQLFGHTNPTEAVQGEGVKLMSYNVRVFDLYNWTKNKQSRDSMFQVFHREDPDILCLQEFFYSPDKRYFRTKDALLKDFRFTDAHERYTQHARYSTHFGIATFSTKPIVAKGYIQFPDNPDNQCIWSDIATDGDTIRVYNAHLASYHFGDDDYKFLKELDTETDIDTIKTGGKRILKRLRRGFRLRANECKQIADHMRESPHPVVYCGDMNDVPMSYGYGLLREVLDDAFVSSGRGLGGTYLGDLPKLRIDHIMYGPGLVAWDFRTLPDEYSDHLPITSMIGIREQ